MISMSINQAKSEQTGYEHPVHYMGYRGDGLISRRVTTFEITQHQKELVRNQVGDEGVALFCFESLQKIVLDGLLLRHKREKETLDFIKRASPEGLEQYFRYAGNPERVGPFMDAFHQLASGALERQLDEVDKGPALEVGSVMMLGDTTYNRVLHASIDNGLGYLEKHGYTVDRLTNTPKLPIRSRIQELSEGVFHLIHERGLANILGPDGDLSAEDHLVERSNSLVIANHLPKPVRDRLSSASSEDDLADIAWRLGNIRDGVVMEDGVNGMFGIIPADETVYIRRKTV